MDRVAIICQTYLQTICVVKLLDYGSAVTTKVKKGCLNLSHVRHTDNTIPCQQNMR